LQGEAVAGEALGGGALAGSPQRGGGQPDDLVFIQDQLEGVGAVQDVLGKARGELAQRDLYLLDAGLLLGRQVGPFAAELLERLFQVPPVDARQRAQRPASSGSRA
jgi:hypothetical protein